MGLDRETRGPEVEILLNSINSFAMDWQIRRMDVTIRGYIIVAVQETSTATYIIE